MANVDELLTHSLSASVRSWFDPKLDHPFFNLQAITVPDSVRPIAKRWMDEIQIDEAFFKGEDGDANQACFEVGLGATWSLEEGKQRLRDSLQRLGIREEHVSIANLDKLSRVELATEKKRVKQELKQYDLDFRKQFSRLPSHTEKEPMRPLYVYYRRLKSTITQAEQLKHASRESMTAVQDDGETPRTRLHSGNNAQSVEDHIAVLEARIETLQAEKSTVRKKLQAFQENFVRENNRKIRFHKDILPIEREYRAHKNLKEEIQKAETQLRDLRAEH